MPSDSRSSLSNTGRHSSTRMVEEEPSDREVRVYVLPVTGDR